LQERKFPKNREVRTIKIVGALLVYLAGVFFIATARAVCTKKEFFFYSRAL